MKTKQYKTELIATIIALFLCFTFLAQLPTTNQGWTINTGFLYEDVNTGREWNEMSESEKHKIIENAVFDLSEQPYWMMSSFEEK